MVYRHLKFIPVDRRSHTLTITYNANAKPAGRGKSTGKRARSQTYGVGFKPPAYKQVNIMAYEPFHFEMVASAVETLVRRSKEDGSDIRQTFGNVVSAHLVHRACMTYSVCVCV